MATLVAERVASMLPCENTGVTAATPTPRPIWAGFTLLAPAISYTRSLKDTWLALNPTVLMLARLLPMTLSASEFAVGPERPAENDPNDMNAFPSRRTG